MTKVIELLVIDDEPAICELVAEVAADLDYSVRQAHSADDVFHQLSQKAPSVIIMDLMMPGMDGVEWLRVMANKVPEAKICLISGSDLRVLNSARSLGSAHGLDVFAIFEKPIDIVQMRNALNALRGQQSSDVSTDDITIALAEEQLTLHYQPIVHIHERKVFGAEALIRWSHPSRGLLFPSDFMDRAYEDGLMQPITRYVLQQATAAAAAWRKNGLNLNISVNMTASSLLDLTLPDQLAELCNKHDLPAQNIMLEITETEAMRDVRRTMDVLLRLRLRGFGLAIDDFGTGYSSLRELQRMPFSEMKIDKSFVMEMANSKDSKVIVNTIINLGHNLGLKIVAEGVEDQRAWDILSERGCDLAQGYFMAKAMPHDKITDWVNQWVSGIKEQK